MSSLISASVTGWTHNVAFPFGGSIFKDPVFFFHTDGLRGTLLFTNRDGTFEAGTDARLSQSVDLTNVSQILFDARLGAHKVFGDATWQSFAEAAVYVDSTKKWSSQTPGTYLNQAIDVTGLSGAHTLSFRLQINSAGSGAPRYDTSSWFEFDNVRSVPEPATMSLLALGGLTLIRRRR